MKKGSVIKSILEKHLILGEVKEGKEITIKIDEVLFQDSTGAIACLEFEKWEFRGLKLI